MEERLGRTMSLTSKLLRERLDRALSHAGSSFPAYMVLVHAEHNPELSQRQLAERLGIESPTLTRHIDRLAAEHLVERVRAHEDRRVSRVELTAKGKAHLDEIRHIADDLDAELRSLFSPRELVTLERLLHRIRDHYGREADVDDRAG